MCYARYVLRTIYALMCACMPRALAYYNAIHLYGKPFRATLVRALALRLRLRGYFFLCVTFFLSGSEMPFGKP